MRRTLREAKAFAGNAMPLLNGEWEQESEISSKPYSVFGITGKWAQSSLIISSRK